MRPACDPKAVCGFLIYEIGNIPSRSNMSIDKGQLASRILSYSLPHKMPDKLEGQDMIFNHL